MNNKLNMYQVFSERVAMQPDHPAIYGPLENQLMSYRELKERIDGIADRLRASGVGPGQCIGLHYPSGEDYIVLTYAIWACGACAVPIAMELMPEEKLRVLHHIRIEFVISDASTEAIFEPLRLGADVELDARARLVPMRREREHPARFMALNPAFLRFTSGTTSTSKGVVLSHETIHDRIHAANDVLKIGPQDNVVWLLSMSYHFTVSIVAYLTFGAGIILSGAYFGKIIVQACRRHDATVIYGSPTHFRLMAHETSGLPLPGLRLAISTTTALTPEIAQAFDRRFGIPLTQAYGIIEIGLPFICTERQMDKLGSVGKLLPAYQMRLLDHGDDADARGIQVRGKGMLDAYYDPWRERAELLTEDGWFDTGDLGRLDEDGFLYIVGRSKEMISVAGMKFFPQELETVLESHPAVKEACVFPAPHEQTGEVAHARVVLREATASPDTVSQELIAYCAAHLASYKVPERILPMSELPRTASGKLIRRA
jgi:long-chain acyl-CoA synthetase